MDLDARLADPSYILARADYDLGWYDGWMGAPSPPAVISNARPNVVRGFADGVWQRSAWTGPAASRSMAKVPAAGRIADHIQQAALAHMRRTDGRTSHPRPS